jgi:BioD-like phosphotransacetylase family protein
MKTVVIGSTKPNAGKTSIIVGMAKGLNKSFGYLKPLGDRLIYRKKRIWDYDTALMTNIFGLTDAPEDMSIGFAHSKLMYSYNNASVQKRLADMISETQPGKEFQFIEGGKDLEYGTSVFLNSIALAEYMKCPLVLVISGTEDIIMDDIWFIKKYLVMGDVDLAGVIINKIHDMEDFQATYMPVIEKAGINILGVIPFQRELTRFSISYITDGLMARVVVGAKGMEKTIENILVGAMSVDAAVNSAVFKKEKKLVITGGDRSDMILAVTEDSETRCVVVTNNILPPPNIISKCEEKDIPLLLVPFDTYETARRLDNIVPLLTPDNSENINRVTQAVKDNVNTGNLL